LGEKKGILPDRGKFAKGGKVPQDVCTQAPLGHGKLNPDLGEKKKYAKKTNRQGKRKEKKKGERNKTGRQQKLESDAFTVDAKKKRKNNTEKDTEKKRVGVGVGFGGLFLGWGGCLSPTKHEGSWK